MASIMTMSCIVFDHTHEEAEDLLVPSITQFEIATTSNIVQSTSTPTPIETSVHPLECAWLTRSITSDEFEKFLVLEATSQDQIFPPRKCEQEDDEDLDLEAFLISASASLKTTTMTTTTTASASAKKRGRPAKPAPASLLTLPPKNSTPINHFNPSSPSSPSRESSPDALCDKYLKMRRSNNEASMKSRLRRKEKESQNAVMVARLTAENSTLKQQLANLRLEFAQLKNLLEKHL